MQRKMRKHSCVDSICSCIKDLLAKSNMVGANGVKTRMFSICKFSRHDNDVILDPTLYMSIFRALQYVTLTRENLAFSVNMACQYMTQPLESHWIAVKYILHYLSGIVDHGLLVTPTNSVKNLVLKAYSDSD